MATTSGPMGGRVPQKRGFFKKLLIGAVTVISLGSYGAGVAKYGPNPEDIYQGWKYGSRPEVVAAMPGEHRGLVTKGYAATQTVFKTVISMRKEISDDYTPSRFGLGERPKRGINQDLKIVANECRLAVKTVSEAFAGAKDPKTGYESAREAARKRFINALEIIKKLKLKVQATKSERLTGDQKASILAQLEKLEKQVLAVRAALKL